MAKMLGVMVMTVLVMLVLEPQPVECIFAIPLNPCTLPTAKLPEEITFAFAIEIFIQKETDTAKHLPSPSKTSQPLKLTPSKFHNPTETTETIMNELPASDATPASRLDVGVVMVQKC
ncbi:hypothetical protein CR513_62552, partial [Mucuna pruriens]